MSFINADQLISSSFYNSQLIPWNKTSIVNEGTSSFTDFFLSYGQPGSGSLPASTSVGGTHYDSSSIGGLYYSRSAANKDDHILSVSFTSTQQGVVYLVDRLWACSGLATASGATSTISSMSDITRYNGGEGCEIAYVFMSGAQATPVITLNSTMSVSYTNTEGVSGRTSSIQFNAMTAGGPTVHQLAFGSLQEGDIGVKSIQSVTNAGVSFSPSANSSHGIVILKKLLMLPAGNGTTGMTLDGLKTNLLKLDKNSCLGFINMGSVGSTGGPPYVDGQGITGFWFGTVNVIST